MSDAINNDDTTVTLDESLMRDYLRDNPDFFNRHPELLLTLQIPHTHRGSVSLVERKQRMLHDRVAQLEEEITALLSMASRNEQIYMFNSALSLKLLNSTDEAELTTILENELKNQFQFNHVRLITVNESDTEVSKIWRERLKQQYYFGRLSSRQSKFLFDADDVGSVALSRLSSSCGKVIFAIGSPDSMHFHPRMESLLLNQLTQVLNYLLPKLKC